MNVARPRYPGVDQDSPLVRVLLCVRGAPLRTGLSTLLETQHGLAVAASSADVRNVVQQARALKANVVVIDLTISGLDAVDVTRRLIDPDARHQARPVLLAGDDPDILAAAIRVGARGAVLREGPMKDLTQAIRAIAAADAYLAAPLIGPVLDTLAAPEPTFERPHWYGTLTRREQQVFELLVSGLPNAEIANRMTVSVRTTKHHVSNILKKLGLRTRYEVIALANGTWIPTTQVVPTARSPQRQVTAPSRTGSSDP